MIEKEVERLDGLAKETIRCAIGELSGTIPHSRALESLKEFRAACDPSTIIDLIRERRSPSVASFLALTAEQRVELMSHCCTFCGTTSLPCYCMGGE